MKTQLGKISHATFGFGGYQDAQIGLSLTFDMKGSGCATFDGHWGTDRSYHAQWTEEDRLHGLGQVVMRLRDILRQADVQHVDQLVGVPVELTFDGLTLKDWRVLTEVI